MNDDRMVELFILKSAALKCAVDSVVSGSVVGKKMNDGIVSGILAQFPAEMRRDADAMSEYYRLFYMLENDIRKLIDSNLTDEYGQNWWQEHAPNSAKDECLKNQQNEREAAVTARSDNPIDYISFGQLGEIMRFNWDVFGGVLSNQKAMGRVMFALNTLRGPIAHCGLLADDEVDRLKLAVKDWLRLLEGPKS